MSANVSMNVNGAAVSGEVEDRTLLVEFLRENLRLTGTHVGCDTSQCGACVVHVDGRSVKACTMLAVQAEGADVATIEGLAQDGQLHPMQEAFRANHGLQCGFCTPGMDMSALDLVARVTARYIDKDNEDDLYVSMFDHGGSAGGYENTWGTGKLYFGSMKVKNCRIHNRPAYNSEVHSTRDMGIGELNYCYEDYTLTDTIFLIGANPLETQTNLFLNHMVPGMRDGARVVIVDPRRTVTANACEQVAGADHVLHLAINSGTDLALFNALFT